MPSAAQRSPARAARATPGLGEVVAAASALAVAGFRRHLRACRDRCGEDSVHELRTHARRLRVLCELLEVLEGGAGITKCRDEVKAIQRALARLRDTHVLLEHLEHVPARVEPGAALWRRRLAREERQLRRRVVRCCRRFRPGRLAGTVNAQIASLRKRERNVGQASSKVRNAEAWVDSLFARVILSQASPDRDPAVALHRLRIALKRFRYAVEALAPLFPGVTAGYRRQLQMILRHLGGSHDADVFLARLAETTEGHPRRAAKLAGVRQWLVRCRASRLRRLEARALRRITLLWPLPDRIPVGSSGADAARKFNRTQSTRANLSCSP